MQVYTLVGKSGSGKSFHAMELCKKKQIDGIIDDGLFIYQNTIVAGVSAKRYVRNEGGLLAFLAVWEFAEFVFIEHFAVSEKARNSGIGGKMLEELARQKAGKVVLEVELPEDSLKKRRIGFYERHGFTFNEYPYIQPPMGEDRHEIPLRIMSAPEPLSEDEFQSVRTELYESVYHYVCEE